MHNQTEVSRVRRCHMDYDQPDGCPLCIAERRALDITAAAREALAVLTRLADSAAYWSDYDVPVGIVAEVDEAKARLAEVLSREARP